VGLFDSSDEPGTKEALVSLSQAVASSSPWQSDRLRLRRVGAVPFPVSVVLNPLGGPGAGGVLVFRDITAQHESARFRRHSEAVLRRQNAAMLDLSRSVALREGHLAEALADITRICSNTLDVERTSVWWLVDDPERIRCADVFERTKDEHSQGMEFLGEGYPAYFRSVREEHVIAAEAAMTDPRTRDLADSYLGPLGIGSLLDVPVLAGGRVLGVVRSEHVGPPRKWTLEDRQFAALAANFVSLAVERADRISAQEELTRALHAAESATRAKTQFLANMSHEIRTPMNAVLGLSEILLESGLPDEPRSQAHGIHSAARALLRVINDVLDVSRIEAGQMELVEHRFDPAAMAREACDTLRPLARAKGLEFHFTSDPDASVWAIGDEGRIRQILLNLAGNAIKFTDRGSVRVSLHAGEKFEDRVYLVFRVSDTGMGIDPSQVETLFLPFVQADASSSRAQSGTGLGLHIARQFAHLMGGEVTVTSAPHVGSTFEFTVTLRCDHTASEPLRAPAMKEAAGAPAGLRVLVAEDNVLNQAVVRSMLETAGHTVLVVEDGIAAVAAFNRERFDCVLMDWQMPKVDGLEATRRIRAHEAAAGLRRTPIIGLSANTMTGDRETMIQAGMDGFVSKPFTRIELLDALPKTAAAGAEPALGKAELRQSAGGLDLTALAKLELIDQGSPGFLSRLVLMFVESTPALIRQLEPGGGVSRAEVQRAAHTLKSSTAMLGGLRLSALAAEAEKSARSGDLDRVYELAPAVWAEFETQCAGLKKRLDDALA
jgi:signal transduction histidine kinase/AmiR/NasT family two-component response regulator/HPt (histidine-containing phosphotransfer) domain-containing protein